MHRHRRYFHHGLEIASAPRQCLYAEVTARVIAELEAGRLPWTQPWSKAACKAADLILDHAMGGE